jgi:hypothetical protein
MSGYALFRIRLNMDVGWMLYLAESVSAGDRLYVDRVEVNLPWIVYLSRIPVALSRALHIPSYTALRWLLLFAVAAAVAVTAKWLRARYSRRPALSPVIAATLFLLFLWMAGSDIGQREHLLVLALAPYLALRWRAEPPSRIMALTVGAVAGMAVALKPHFLILWAAIEAGRRINGLPWRRPEVISAAVVVLFSLILLPVVHPAYFSVLREYGQLYSRFRPFPVAGMLRVEAITLLVILAAWLAGGRAGSAGQAVRDILLVAGASLIVALIQAKGFTYHLLPTHVFAALGLLVAFLVFEPVGRNRWQTLPMLLLLCASLGLYVAWAGSIHRWSESPRQGEYRPAVELIERSELQARSIMVLSPHMLDAFPLVNLSGMQWTSRYNSLWPLLSLYAGAEPVAGTIPFRRRPEMDGPERSFFQHVADDFIEQQPDLILVAEDEDSLLGGRFDYLEYLRQDSTVAEALTAYETVARRGRLQLYARKELLRAARRR